MVNFDLTVLQLFVPEVNHSLGVFPVVNEPLSRALDALQRAVQALELFFECRCRKTVRSHPLKKGATGFQY